MSKFAALHDRDRADGAGHDHDYADRWLAGLTLESLPESLHASLPAVALLLAVSVAAHLFVTSRSARAAVLIPAGGAASGGAGP